MGRLFFIASPERHPDEGAAFGRFPKVKTLQGDLFLACTSRTLAEQLATLADVSGNLLVMAEDEMEPELADVLHEEKVLVFEHEDLVLRFLRDRKAFPYQEHVRVYQDRNQSTMAGVVRKEGR